jgi:hypothetical protein
MSDPPKPTEKALREARLQAALRENLKRRKDQARGRKELDRAAHDSAGIATDKGEFPGATDPGSR